MRRLWRGLALWNKELESHDADSSGGSVSAQERKKATAADKQRFRELAHESEQKRN